MFYLPGYDPIHPRRYREIYRKESQTQSRYSGHEIAIRPSRDGRFGWHVDARIEGKRIETQIEVLVWSDIVRASMEVGIVATYVQLFRTAAIYLRSGALWRLVRLRKGPALAALYPPGMLVFQLALAISAMAFVVDLVVQMGNGSSLLTMMAILAALGVAAAVLRGFRRLDHRLFAYYLMNDYAFSARWNGAYPIELERRIDDFVDILTAALREDLDEVLVVGHSSGAQLAVSVLAEFLRRDEMHGRQAALSFLSLGQVIPMVSFLPAADRLRADLHFLSQSKKLTWIDVTAPGDGCAFALCDPVAVSGVSPGPSQRWPRILSAAFRQTLRPETFRALRWRFFRLHFQYLCAFDNLPERPDCYDYFAITGGPLTLNERLGARQSSHSTIDRCLSGHTSMAA